MANRSNLLQNRYRLVELIGRGGMGEVYRAHDLTLSRDVAVKILPESMTQEAESVDRFYREARAAAQLNHQNIVTIHDVGEDAGRYFIVMELVEGTVLSELMGEGKALTPAQLFDYALQICSGLGAAHQQGILHRDLKPVNMMVTPTDLVKILDFGLAKIVGMQRLTLAGQVLGTVAYIAPEQVLDEEVDARADIYALGVVLYEMATGQVPFMGDDPMAIIYQHINDDPLPPTQRNPAISSVLEEVILCALAKDPAERYGSVAELSRDLQAAQTGATVKQVLARTQRRLPLTTPTLQGLMPRSLRRELAKPLVGRQEELKQLKTWLYQAREGQSRLVFIEGEAGVGKTRLVNELRSFAEAKGVWSTLGECLYNEGMIPYHPFIGALAHHLAADQSDLYQQKRVELGDKLQEEAPELAQWLLGVQGTGKPREAEQLTGEAARMRLFQTIFEVILYIAEVRPFLLILDDMHWADNASLQLLHYIIRGARNIPLLVLVTYRPEDLVESDGELHPLTETMQRMGREGLYEKLTLERLPREDIAKLVGQLLIGGQVTEDLPELLYQETEGNPLFTIEFLKWLRDEGALVKKGKSWRLSKKLDRLAIPARIQDVLARRVNRLERNQRELMQVAAVVGEKFNAILLSRILHVSKINMLRELNRLERGHGIIYPEDRGYRFSHGKIREVLYGELVPELRQAYHLQAGQVLEELNEDDLDSVVGQLANHYLLGKDFQKAYPFLCQAGGRALDLFAFREAASYFEKAMIALPKAVTQSDRILEGQTLSLKLGKVYYELGDWNRSLDSFKRAAKFDGVPAPVAIQAEALLRLGAIISKQNRRDQALRLYAKSLELYKKVKDSLGIATVYTHIGNIHNFRGLWSQSEDIYLKALKIAQQGQHDRIVADLYNNLGIVALSRGNKDEAKKYYEEGMMVYKRIGNMYGLGLIYNNLGMLSEEENQLEKARQLYVESANLFRKSASTNQLASVYLNLAKVLSQIGEIGEANAMCNRGLEIVYRLQDQRRIGEANRVRALIAMANQNWTVAENYLKESIQISRHYKDLFGLGESYRYYGQFNRKKNNKEQAIYWFNKAVDLFQEIGAQTYTDKTIKEATEIKTSFSSQ